MVALISIVKTWGIRRCSGTARLLHMLGLKGDGKAFLHGFLHPGLDTPRNFLDIQARPSTTQLRLLIVICTGAATTLQSGQTCPILHRPRKHVFRPGILASISAYDGFNDLNCAYDGCLKTSSAIVRKLTCDGGKMRNWADRSLAAWWKALDEICKEEATVWKMEGY